MQRTCGILLLAAALSPDALHAEPPADRTMVAAVADAASNRILVRWSTEEGTPRYTYFDVMRRRNDEAAFTRLNTDPIGPLTSVLAIEEVFSNPPHPDRADALASIQLSFGADYASDILAMQSATAPPEAQLQRRMLPEQNYGAAIAMGVGLMDETAVLDSTYVYEVWGLDALGAAVERLGRATATSGAPDPLAAPGNLACVSMGGAPGDLAANLRWEEPVTDQPFLGYDVFRAKADGAGMCPAGMAGAVVVNAFPLLRSSPGHVSAGQRLFAAGCTGGACHVSRSDDSIRRSTIRDFRRKQYADCTPPVAHDTPALNALTPEDVRAVYDYIHAFNFQDDGEAVPAEPLIAKDRFCYEVAARDLLGKYGTKSDIATCGIPDRRAPAVPKQIQATRPYNASTQLETCEISWKKNTDDTARYRIYRFQGPNAPRGSCAVEALTWIATVDQPAGAGRVVFTDSEAALAVAQPYYYAVRAEDDAGFDTEPDNRSGFSGWVPCTPRDRQAPQASTIDITCPTCPPPAQCVDHVNDPPDSYWKINNGSDIVVAKPGAGNCPPEIHVTPPPGDTFGQRVMRLLPGDTVFRPLEDSRVLPITIDYAPLTDTRVCYGVKGYDKSGNQAALSDTECLVLEGSQPLPPPRVISYSVLDETTGKVLIRFRSLEPGDLVGFALYTSDENVEPPLTPETPGCLKNGYPLGNLGGGVDPTEGPCPRTPPGPADWVILDSTVSLDQALPWIDGGLDESLTYTGNRIYELTVHLPFTKDVRIWLHAIGWSGRDGLGVPHVARTFQVVDGKLAWPEHVDHNPNPPDVVPAYYTDGIDDILPDAGGFMLVRWRPQPRCDCSGVNRPMAVFRRRAVGVSASQEWEQVSPLFNCDQTNCPVSAQERVEYHDRDVESGVSYMYRIVRLDEKGEFLFENLRPGFTCYPNNAACSALPPE